MTIEFFDSFDLYSDIGQVGQKYSTFGSPIYSASSGRFGGGAVTVSGAGHGLKRIIEDSVAYFTFGFAFKATTMPTLATTIVSSSDTDSATSQFDINMAVVLDSDGKISIRKDGYPIVATSAISVISENNWYYIEVAFNRATSGLCTVYVNGTSVVSVTSDFYEDIGLHAVHFGSTSADNGTYALVYDDVYVAYDASATPAPYGDIKAEVLGVDGGDVQADWTGSYTDVQSNDGDTTKITSATVGHKSEFTLASLSESPSAIHAVNAVAYSSKSASGACEIKTYLDSGGTEAIGLAITPSESGYEISHDIHETDPATAVAWTESGVNAVKVGVEVTG